MPREFADLTRKGVVSRPLLRILWSRVGGDDNLEAYLALMLKFGLFVQAKFVSKETSLDDQLFMVPNLLP